MIVMGLEILVLNLFMLFAHERLSVLDQFMERFRFLVSRCVWEGSLLFWWCPFNGFVDGYHSSCIVCVSGIFVVIVLISAGLIAVSEVLPGVMVLVGKSGF
jgi:hypothetical protein